MKNDTDNSKAKIIHPFVPISFFQSISCELKSVAREIRNELAESPMDNKVVQGVNDYFFGSYGKMLRPALVILSAKAVSAERRLVYNEDNENDIGHIIKFGVAMELIHNASLVHDDIIDESQYRRGQLTVKEQYSNHVAVLYGDFLYTKSLSLLTGSFNKTIVGKCISCIERMAKGEMFTLATQALNIQDYMRLIVDKTALFMSLCCEVGAMQGTKDPDKIEQFRQFGMNIGIAYQLIDDHKDGDMVMESGAEPERIKWAKEYIESAEQNLDCVSESRYKKCLKGFAHYLYGFTKEKVVQPA